jgi:hypothetical protein
MYRRVIETNTDLGACERPKHREQVRIWRIDPPDRSDSRPQTAHQCRFYSWGPSAGVPSQLNEIFSEEIVRRKFKIEHS